MPESDVLYCYTAFWTVEARHPCRGLPMVQVLFWNGVVHFVPLSGLVPVFSFQSARLAAKSRARKLTFEVQSLIGILKAYEKLYALQ